MKPGASPVSCGIQGPSLAGSPAPRSLEGRRHPPAIRRAFSAARCPEEYRCGNCLQGGNIIGRVVFKQLKIFSRAINGKANAS